MSDDRKTTLTDGSPVTSDHRELLPNGQQKGYVVLSEEERAKGFVRPVRTTYKHVGKQPAHSLRELTTEEHEEYDKYGYVAYEDYNAGPDEACTGRFWTAEQLKGGCQIVTIMGVALAETYARDPKFYGGTFCCGCGKHFPVDEFVWEGTNEKVGS